MVSFLMILNEPNLVFKVTISFKVNISKMVHLRDKVSLLGLAACRTLKESRRQAIEWQQFQ